MLDPQTLPPHRCSCVHDAGLGAEPVKCLVEAPGAVGAGDVDLGRDGVGAHAAPFSRSRRRSSRSEEHTSELQSLMRISYAVFCLKQKTHTLDTQTVIMLLKTLH